MRLPAHQHALVEELMHLADPHERLAAAVDRARRGTRLTTEERSNANRVSGCSSTVWMRSELRNGRCYFRADADSPVVRGLVGLLADFFSDARPAEIAESVIDPLEVLGLNRMLTPTRRNGLAAVHAAIRAFAARSVSADRPADARGRPHETPPFPAAELPKRK